ncbi:hypothetical protein V3565_00625 [Bartonella sp. B10]
MLRIVDLFASIGEKLGFDQAFSRFSVQCVFTFEIASYSVRTHQINFDVTTFYLLVNSNNAITKK